MQWKLLFVEGYKVLFISPEVADRVAEHTKSGGGAVLNETDIDRAFVDEPGMCMADRHIWSGDLGDGLRVDIPATDVDGFIYQMQGNIDKEKFTERGWWNVYGWQHCLCLSRGRYLKLLGLLQADRDEMRRIAEQECDRLAQGIKRVNEELAAMDKGVSFAVPTVSKKPVGGSWN